MNCLVDCRGGRPLNLTATQDIAEFTYGVLSDRDQTHRTTGRSAVSTEIFDATLRRWAARVSRYGSPRRGSRKQANLERPIGGMAAPPCSEAHFRSKGRDLAPVLAADVAEMDHLRPVAAES